MDYTVYTDGFPWLKWSRHFTGETSVRVKLIESYNLLSTVLTVALWSGNDDYETTKKCGNAVYKQLKVIPLKLFYYQTFFETWRNEHS